MYQTSRLFLFIDAFHIHALHSFILLLCRNYLLFMRRRHVSYSRRRTYFSFMLRIYFSFMRHTHFSFMLHTHCSCTSLLVWNIPDQSIFLACIKTSTPCSEDCYSCIALTYRSCVAFFHYPCIIYTALCSLACFLSSSCIKSRF